MKILKYLLYLVGALLLIILLLGLFGPKSFDVSRTAIVPGTTEQVWPYVSSLKNMQTWSPWAEKDTAMTIQYSGNDGEVGSSSSWTGNKDVGEGSQTITALEPKSYVETKLVFLKPMSSEATGYMRLQDTTGGTFVTWGIKGENGFIGRVFDALMNLEKAMAPDFDRGLSKLSELMASVPKTDPSGMTVMTGDYPGGKYLGTRATMTFDKMEEFYGKAFGSAMEAIEKAGATMVTPPSGLYFTWDMEKMTTDLAAGFGFTGDLKAPEGMQVIELPASKSLTIDYYGGYNGIGKAHDAMDAYMKANNLTQGAPVIEEYITDPMTEPDSNKWLTKVIYFVK